MSERGLSVGVQAPDFTLMEAAERPVHLEDELRKGPVLLLFYPNDFGVICSLEMRTVMEMLQELDAKGVGVLAISCNSPYTHRQWKENLGIPFPLLADNEGVVCQKYAGLQDSGLMQGRPKRAVFLLDRKGRIRYIWVAKAEGLLPPFDEMMEKVKTLDL